MSDDLMKRLRAMAYPPALDDQDGVMSYVLDAEEDAIAAVNRIEELTAERDALLALADWVRRYQAEWETPAPDLTLRANIRQAMFDALDPEDGERCPAGICRRPAGHAGPHSDLPRGGER